MQEGVAAADYAKFIGEATISDSYLKAPFYRPQGWPMGIYRVGPLGRINVAEAMGTPRADAELKEFRQRFGRVAHSSFLYHYARLIEIVYGLEALQLLLQQPDALDTHVRAEAGVNSLEGVGMIEAPRGTLIHHYKVDEDGAITWANLIVATGHNNRAIGDGVRQVARAFHPRRQTRRRDAEPRFGAGAGLRSLPQLLHPRDRSARVGHLAGGREGRFARPLAQRIKMVQR